jgi:ATP-binding cassette subfamily B protein RaxB
MALRTSLGGAEKVMHLDAGLIGRRRVRHIRQTEMAECGLACLAMVANFHGLNVDLNALRRRFVPSMRGASFKSLVSIADRLGLTSRPVKLPLEAMRELHLPAVLHWNMNHYVVLERFERGKASIYDPAAGGARHLGMDEVSRSFTGVALELRPAPGFGSIELRQRLRLRQLWAQIRGWRRAASQALVLTVVLQAFVLASPYYMQLAVDSVVPTGDGDLLAVLALGFGLFTVFNAGATLLRGFVLLSAGASIGFTFASNLAYRLFRLPVTWFERRHVGDVLSRFQSVHPIQEALTQGVVAAFVDGVLSVLTLVLMIWYSPALAGIAFAAFTLYVIVRLVSFEFERQARENLIVSTGKEQSALIETIRGIVTVRLFGREAERHALWQNRMTDEVNASLGASRIGIWQSTANTLLFGFENVLTIFVSIKLVLGGSFTIGMVVAYLAYKQLFLTRVATLVDQAIAFRMLGLHLERLADIALEDEDGGFEPGADRDTKFNGALELRNVFFRYSTSDPLVLNAVNLSIHPGAHVAITGASGGGKSTLAKIILGLVEPETGNLLADGMPLSQFGYRSFRSQIAAVLQDDSLFAGTIADNIALFDGVADEHRILRAAMAAAIHDEIMAMPLRYETLVGDMGSTLSGGQKARVLLARALYREPRLILLDEGTAHLDQATEQTINRSISALGITRIVIAHRSATVSAAEEVYELENGRLNRLPDMASEPV